MESLTSNPELENSLGQLRASTFILKLIRFQR